MYLHLFCKVVIPGHPPSSTACQNNFIISNKFTHLDSVISFFFPFPALFTESCTVQAVLYNFISLRSLLRCSDKTLPLWNGFGVPFSEGYGEVIAHRFFLRYLLAALWNCFNLPIICSRSTQCRWSRALWSCKLHSRTTLACDFRFFISFSESGVDPPVNQDEGTETSCWWVVFPQMDAMALCTQISHRGIGTQKGLWLFLWTLQRPVAMNLTPLPRSHKRLAQNIAASGKRQELNGWDVSLIISQSQKCPWVVF